jgi:hypothetical protein
MPKNHKRKPKRFITNKIRSLRETTGILDASLLQQIYHIHHAANLIRLKGYAIVDQASNPESRNVLETELCRAMALKAGEGHFMYRPYRGPIVNDWTIGC